MAKEQGLSLNPTKISGTCGRLMCCLKYEQGAYEDAVKRCPKQDSFVDGGGLLVGLGLPGLALLLGRAVLSAACPDGAGTVSAVNVLKEQVKVRLEDATDQPPRSFSSSALGGAV